MNKHLEQNKNQPIDSITKTPKAHSPDSFPAKRMRRNRTHAWVRNMVAENHLRTDDLVWPLFVIEGQNETESIASMPNVSRHSIDLIVQQAKNAYNVGIPALALFPALDTSCKTYAAEESYNQDNLLNRAVYEIKNAVPEIGIITDVALDPYTSHGHDGILRDGKILNDETVHVLCKQAIAQAKAGADIIAPSDMMDGRIGAIRKALDDEGFQDVKIMSYAVKYASNFYGPFRDAVRSGGLLQGDKKTYQMNPANGNEALKEASLDLNEGADMIMIKPGMPYLDVIRKVKDTFHAPTFAYQVSGEYSMIKLASDQGLFDYETIITETLLGFKRAGADGILTYSALDVAHIITR